MALKITSKVMDEITYSWRQFLKIVEFVLDKAVNKLKKHKLSKLVKQTSGLDLDDPEEVKPEQVVNLDIEIGNDFFRDNLLPTTHKLLMSNVKLQNVCVFNLIIALRLALLFETINFKEYNFIM